MLMSAMASHSSSWTGVLFCTLLFSTPFLSTGQATPAGPPPNALFVFGDSYVDTGNLNKSVGLGHSWQAPYGETYPGSPSGRFSNGRVFTDIFASALQMPSPVPYERRGSEVGASKFGINFAVGGSGVFNAFGTPSLRSQVDKFESQKYTPEFLQSSVVLVGLHGNDYGAWIAQGNPLSGLSVFQQSVINEMALQLERLHTLGLKTFYVDNLQPVGCLPSATAPTFMTCIEIGNEIISDPHNKLMAASLADLKKKLPGASFTVLDHFSAFKAILQDPAKYGMSAGPLKPCCSGVSNGIPLCGGVDSQGKPMFSVCNDPAQSFFWDAGHPSQAGWIAITKVLFPNAKLGPFS